MFIPVTFASVNQEGDLPHGTYSAMCSHYRGRTERIDAFLFDYTPAGATGPAAYDLLVLDADGALRARDFVWLPDRSWRDSDGARANDIASLLPAELRDLSLAAQDRLPDIVVSEGSDGEGPPARTSLTLVPRERA